MPFRDRRSTRTSSDPATDELDLVAAGKPLPSADARGSDADARVPAPPVVLGETIEGGLAPAILAIIERGVRRRPAQARALIAEIELALEKPYPPVRIAFEGDRVLVADGPAAAADLRVSATLADLTHMMVTPLLGGVPSPVHARGRAALGMLAGGRVRVQGQLGLMRRLLGVIRI